MKQKKNNQRKSVIKPLQKGIKPVDRKSENSLTKPYEIVGSSPTSGSSIQDDAIISKILREVREQGYKRSPRSYRRDYAEFSESQIEEWIKEAIRLTREDERQKCEKGNYRWGFIDGNKEAKKEFAEKIEKLKREWRAKVQRMEIMSGEVMVFELERLFDEIFGGEKEMGNEK